MYFDSTPPLESIPASKQTTTASYSLATSLAMSHQQTNQSHFSISTFVIWDTKFALTLFSPHWGKTKNFDMNVKRNKSHVTQSKSTNFQLQQELQATPPHSFL